MIEGGYGRRPGGRRFASGQGVGSGVKMKGIKRRMLLMGRGRIEGGNEKIPKNGRDRWSRRVIINFSISYGS